MSTIYLPYMIGKNSPIPYLFEQIIPEMQDSEYEFVTHTNDKDINLGDNTKELYSHDPSSVRRKLSWGWGSIKNYDLIHTGGRPSKHYHISQLTNFGNRSQKHIHTFRVDVDPDGEFKTKYRQKLAKEADLTTAVSKHTAKTVKSHFGIEPKVVYNGVRPDIFRPDHEPSFMKGLFKSDKQIFIFVGSLIDRKRPQDVIRVAEAVPEAEFIFIGDGPLFDEVRKKEKEMDNIHVIGRIEKERLPPLYANSSALVFPSIREGCPNVVLEAMASGIPVIGYDATSMNELISHGQTGYLAQKGNVDGLISGIKNIICDNGGQNMGEKAREYIIENHSFSHISEQYLELYTDLLDTQKVKFA